MSVSVPARPRVRWASCASLLTAAVVFAAPAARAGAAPDASPSPSASPSPTACVQVNGPLLSATPTSLTFEIPGFACYPQAIFNVTVYEGSPTGPSTRGTGGRDTGLVTVTGLVPGTEYWYHFDGAPMTGPVATQPDHTCSATYRVVDQWNAGGYQAEVRVTAGALPISGWTVHWTLADGQTVSQAWNTALTVTGSTVTAGNAGWNGSLAAGATTAFGLLGTWTGSNPPATVTCSAR